MTGTFVRIALRNIVKNKRRSFVTIIAIGVGFAALSLFRGYTSNVYHQLELSAVIQEGLGHLTVYKKGWLDQGTLDPKRFMMSKAEVEQVIAKAKSIPGVRIASPKLNVTGLFSNGQVSTIFIGEGVVAEDYNALIHSEGSNIKGDLDASKPAGIHVSEGLAHLLGLKQGTTSVLSAATLDASMNAVNADITRLYNTGVPDTNDKYVRMPLSLARELLDADGADRVMVVLNDSAATLAVRERLQQQLAAAGLDVEIKTWEERSAFYTGTIEMFGMLLTFMGTIVLIIVIMSVINTMAVSVLERTREIGTLRVLGMKRAKTALLFAAEGGLLGLLGSVIGLVIHSAVWAAITIAEPMYVPPGVSEPVPFGLQYVPAFLVALILAMLAFTLLAAILPARRAARQNVVVSLGYV